MRKIFILIALLLVFTGCGLEKFKTDEEYLKDMATTDPEKVTFYKDSRFGIYYGTLNLTGYLDIETRICESGNHCSETVDYAFFVITETGNEAIKQFFLDLHGNSFVGTNKIGLGCYQKDQSRIFYLNTGDNGSVEISISGEQLVKLLSATEKYPVSLRLTKPFYSGGKGAPDCYSHFRNFKVL